MSKNSHIIIKGARQHNLKNIDVEIPKNKITVVTGVSGSGKSSLSIDTLFAEGQRRYAESLNSYVRQFVSRLPKPDVDYIENLCPAISIDQKVRSTSTRSTVGTMTEVYDYLKILYARIGETFSPISHNKVSKDTAETVWNKIDKLEEGKTFLLLFKTKSTSTVDLTNELQLLERQGYTKLYNSTKKELISIDEMDFNAVSDLENWYVVKDRGRAKAVWTDDDKARWHDSIESCFHEGNGNCWLEYLAEIIHFSNKFEADGMLFEWPTPDFFAFGNSYGVCKKCQGNGQVFGIDHWLVIPNRNLSLYEDAVVCWKTDAQKKWKDNFIKNCGKYDFPIHRKIKDLSEQELDMLWNGAKGLKGINDFFEEIESNSYKIQYRVMLSRYRGKTECPDCNGVRIRKDALYVKIADTNISQQLKMPINLLYEWYENLELTPNQSAIAHRLLIEIKSRLKMMIDIGLDYLSLNRDSDTLSGGESQRIHLTRLLGSNLSESLYVLDEPSIGLHPRDTQNLMKVLSNLRDLGNTVVVVEHEELIIRNADYIIDIGPGAGVLGGHVIAHGSSRTVLKNKNSLTGKYLSGELKIARKRLQLNSDKYLKINNLTHFNLKNFSAKIPLNKLTVICGVSGSGKSTMMHNIVWPALQKALHVTMGRKDFSGVLEFDRHLITGVEYVDQNPIGKSSRSNPVTYIKAYDEIRMLFAGLHLSQIRGFKPGHFSFNTDGGRCDTCKGEGEITIKMQFLADINLQCEACLGKRFKDEILEVKYKQKNIFDILTMNVDEAVVFFKDDNKIQQKLIALQKVGLGYIALGQSSSTLSGGEAQRVKLATYLIGQNRNEKFMFIFDEPTTGLHFHDVNTLLASFDELLQYGHTIVLIEHNLDVIKQADWVIELGPEGGQLGGYLLYEGDVEGLRKCENSITAKYL